MTGATRDAMAPSSPALRSFAPAGGLGETPYAAAVIDTTEAVIARVRALESAHDTAAARATAFQSAPWLEALGRALTRDGSGHMLAVEIADPASGSLAALLPLVVRREGRLRVARFADIGVCDYRAPIIGPAAPETGAGRTALWHALLDALAGRADLVRFEAMPREIGGRPNPLVTLPAVRAARLTGMQLGVDTTVEDFLRGRGKKYRKEAERCFRLLEKEGVPSFRRAETPDTIERAYAALEAQQSQRHGDAGNEHYVLDQPKFSEFYRDLLLAERASGFAQIFTLESEGRIVAALLGILHDGSFTALRISNGGPLWRHLSPGRLVVIETMRYMVARGIRSFDLGAGDYPFKRGLGAAEIPLCDLVAPVSVRGWPAVAADRTKSWLKQHPALANAARRLAGRS